MRRTCHFITAIIVLFLPPLAHHTDADDAIKVDDREATLPVTILSSGNTCGIFEPCRCPTNPYGGVARRATLIAGLRGDNPNLLLVDSGNVFDSSTSQAYGDLLTWAYRLCSYDAVALGSLDVMYARKVGAERFKAMGIPWVCANMESGADELGVVKYRILERGNKRIAVTAILGTRLVNRDILKNGDPPIVLTNPVAALNTLMAELRPKVDVICVLAHLERSQSEYVLNNVQGIDLIILGHDKGLGKKTIAGPNGSVFVETGPSGQYLAVTRGNLEVGQIDWSTEYIPIDEKVANHPALWERYERVTKGRSAAEVATVKAEEFRKHMTGGNGATDELPRVAVAVFKSEGCAACEAIEPGNLEKLARKKGCRIDAKYFQMDRASDYELLLDLERKYGDEGNELPAVFIGTCILGGTQEIESDLPKLVMRYAQEDEEDETA